MTVSTQNTFVTYVGDGITVHFDFNFYALDTAWLHVFQAGIEVFSFTPVVNPDQNAVPGGFVVMQFAPGPGVSLEIKRETPTTQETHYVPYSAFPAQSHENALDKLTAEIQDLIGTAGLPSQTGKAGDVLSTDGTVASWVTLLSLLPQPLIPGTVLGTDGTIIEWITGGGGGGGVSIVGPPVAAQPNAALITGFEIQMGIADATHPGVLTAAGSQTVGGLKLFPGGAATNVMDIRNFGAVSFPGPQTLAPGPGNNNPPTVDCSPAFEAAIAAIYSNSYLKAGTIYVPEGTWYISRPIYLPIGVCLVGEGGFATSLNIGQANPGDPTYVNSFSGTMVKCITPAYSHPTFHPEYGASLLPGPGRSMALRTTQAVFLHDAAAWCSTLENNASMGLRFPVFVTNLGVPNVPAIWPDGPPQVFASIIGCEGFGGEGPGLSKLDGQFFIGCQDAGPGLFKFKAQLTTTVSGQQVITTGNYPIGAQYDVEFDYNGSFFDFYINGINQGHVAMTGLPYRTPWEGVSIGAIGPEQGLFTASINGFIDNIVLSDVPFHTGVGSFTPPAAKLTASGHTLALINFDQGDAPVGSGDIIGQVRNSIIWSSVGWGAYPPTLTKHYMRLHNTNFNQGYGQSGSLTIKGIWFWGAYNVSAITAWVSPFTRIDDCQTGYTTMFGVQITDASSFYCEFSNNFHASSMNFGAAMNCLQANNIQSEECRIGQHLIGGNLKDSFDQPFSSPPTHASFIPFIFGYNLQGVNSSIIVQYCDDDDEFDTPSMKYTVLIGGIGSATFFNNEWVNPNSAAPLIKYATIPNAGATHFSEVYGAGPGSLCTFFLENAPDPTLQNSKIKITNYFDFSEGIIPFTNRPGWIVTERSGSITNQAGISTSDVPAKNLSGTFQIKFGQTTGGVRFLQHEPDGNYEVIITGKKFSGSTPSLGSLAIQSIATSAAGFIVTVGADPGGSSFVTYSWLLVRTQPPPELWVIAPAIPSSQGNPLTISSPTGDFAVAITVVPANGAAMVLNTTQPAETLVEAGFPSATDFWELALYNAGRYQPEIGVNTVTMDSFVSGFGIDGRLAGLLNPGSHNVVFVMNSINWGFYIDGVSALNWSGYPTPLGAGAGGTQQTPIHIGERAGGSQALTSVVTLRNLKVDKIVERVITNEPDYGPWGIMDSAQCAFFGDDMTVGNAATGAGVGGFASQIAINRYLTKYYWIAASSGFFPTQTLLEEFWSNWGAYQQLIGMNLMAGRFDIANNLAAPVIMEFLKGFIEGVKSSAIFRVPTIGSSTCVINGISFTSTFSVDSNTTVNNLIALVNASGPTTAIITPVNILDPLYGVVRVMQVTANTRGPIGDAIIVSSDTPGAWNFPLPLHPYNTIPRPPLHLVGGVPGAIAKGINPILFCNVPPLGAIAYSPAREVQRVALNALINAYTGAGVTVVDVDTLLADPGTPHQLLPAYTTDLSNLNNAGHTALYGLINPLLP